MQIFPFHPSLSLPSLFPANESLILCVWILLLLQSMITSEDLCKCSMRNVEIKVEFFCAMCFFLMFINAVCGLFLTIKKFKKGKCFSSQLNFVSHYKNVTLRMNISRELKKCLQLSLLEGGRGTGTVFVTGSPIFLLPTFACFWSSYLGNNYDRGFHFQCWGRPF